MPGDVLGTHILQETGFRQARAGFSTRAGLHKHFARGMKSTALRRRLQIGDAVGNLPAGENSADAAGHHPGVATARSSCWPARIRLNSKAHYPLPEAQRGPDFLFRLLFDNVDTDVLAQIDIPSAAGASFPRRRGRWSARSWNRCFSNDGAHLLAAPGLRDTLRRCGFGHACPGRSRRRADAGQPLC